MSPTSKAAIEKNDTKVSEANKETTIIFEEDLYKKEKKTKELDANLFVGYIIEFFEEEEDIIIPPTDIIDGNSPHFIHKLTNLYRYR